MKARIIQLLSRYIAMALASFGFANIDDQATAISTGIVSITLVCFDLWLHRKKYGKA